VKSTAIKRSGLLVLLKTSISLEEEFWEGLKDIAQADHMTASVLLVAVRKCRSNPFETIRALPNHEAQAL
jgi:predicted DNA-binding ribbon-helix-helix protein